MAEIESSTAAFEEDDHRVGHSIPPRSLFTDLFQVAYIFNAGQSQSQVAQTAATAATARPAKRRKVAKTTTIDAPKQQQAAVSGSAFPPLFNGAERPDAVQLRQDLFATAWPVLEARVQVNSVS